MAKKKPFMYMSTNEWLGDSVTHFMKTGNALRSDENDELANISNLIPKIANGVKIEYDISYESPKDRIHGYKYTDLLTKVVMISPCNSTISVQNLINAIKKEPTEEGLAVVATETLELDFLLQAIARHIGLHFPFFLQYSNMPYLDYIPAIYLTNQVKLQVY